MRKTVTNTNSYIESILSDYPYFPSHAKSFLAEELTALQRGYFALCPEVVSKKKLLQSDFQIALSALCDSTEGIPLSKDIVAVFHDGKELPKRDVLHFYRSTEPGYTVENERIVCRSAVQNANITVLVACCPKNIEYSASTGYKGDICIAEEHLPLASARLRELAARLSGEEEEADHFADCYNAWLKRLKEEKGEKK